MPYERLASGRLGPRRRNSTWLWSRPFDIHRASDHPSVNGVVDILLTEIVALRGSQNRRIRNRADVRQHLKAFVLDLYLASLERNPGSRRSNTRWLGVIRSKRAFAKMARYNRLFLTYRPLIGVLDDLIDLGYVKQKLGFHDRSSGIGFTTRIRGRSKLHSIFARLQLDQTAITPIQREPIVLRNSDGIDIDYEDTPQILEWREQLGRINDKIARMRIRLYLSDLELQALRRRMWRQKQETLDYAHWELRRVFNNGRFDQGGRFYGGWWQNIPSETRKYLEINYKSTVEVDFKGLQLRMLYALEGLQAPDDPYDAPNWPRQIQKKGILVLLNAETRESAVRALASQGISQVNQLIDSLQRHHAPIARHLHSGIGVNLQFYDSRLAAAILDRSLINVLPVHDSFVVRIGSERELVDTMETVFTEQFPGQRPSMEFKGTVLDDLREQREAMPELPRQDSTHDDIETLLETQAHYSEYHS